jgi:hypothetical protein
VDKAFFCVCKTALLCPTKVHYLLLFSICIIKKKNQNDFSYKQTAAALRRRKSMIH